MRGESVERAAVLVDHAGTVVTVMETTHNVLQGAVALGGVAALGTQLAFTAVQLATEQGLAACARQCSTKVVTLLVEAEIANYASRNAVALAERLGVDPDYIRIGADALQVVLLWRAARGQCFVAGTEVLAADPAASGAFSEKKIEDIQVGDEVWSKDQNNPNAPMELKRVTQVFSHTAFDLQKVRLLDVSTGDVEELDVTDNHPFYVEGLGWTGAGQLAVGAHLLSPDGLSTTAHLVFHGNGVDASVWRHKRVVGDRCG